METKEISKQELPQELVQLQESISLKTNIDSSDILKNFSRFFHEMASIKKSYGMITSWEKPTDDDCKAASVIRKRIVKVRTASEKLKDELGRDYHTVHKMITSANTLISSACKLDEENLVKVEKFAELKEKARLEELKRIRTEAILPYGFNTDDGVGLEKMSEDVWDTFLSGIKKKHEDRLAAEKKEQKEKDEFERKRKLHYDRKDQIAPYWNFIPEDQKGNDLSNYSEEEFYAMADHLKNKKKIFDEDAEKQRQENERLRKQKAESDAKLNAEREAREKSERELKAKQDEEKRVQAEKEAAEKKRIAEEKKAAKAPDKEKLKKAIADMSMDKAIADSLKSKESLVTYSQIFEKFEWFKKWALGQIELL